MSSSKRFEESQCRADAAPADLVAQAADLDRAVKVADREARVVKADRVVRADSRVDLVPPADLEDLAIQRKWRSERRKSTTRFLLS